MDSLPILCRYISFVYIFLMGTFMIYHRAACIINVKISIFLKTLCRFWRENLKLEENFSFHHESGERSMSFRRPNFCTQKLWMQSFVLFKKNMLIFFSLVVNYSNKSNFNYLLIKDYFQIIMKFDKLEQYLHSVVQLA